MLPANLSASRASPLRRRFRAGRAAARGRRRRRRGRAPRSHLSNGILPISQLAVGDRSLRRPERTRRRAPVVVIQLLSAGRASGWARRRASTSTPPATAPPVQAVGADRGSGLQSPVGREPHRRCGSSKTFEAGRGPARRPGADAGGGRRPERQPCWPASRLTVFAPPQELAYFSNIEGCPQAGVQGRARRSTSPTAIPTSACRNGASSCRRARTLLAGRPADRRRPRVARR